VAGTAAGQPVEASWHRPIPPLSAREQRAFRFLEPRRISLDQIQVFQVSAEGPRAIAPVQAAFVVRGGEEYQVVVRPQTLAVRKIDLKDVPGLALINKVEEDSERRLWKFLLELSFNDLWSKPKRLFYNVESRDAKLTGEIHLLLRPAWGRHALVALALGVAITLQGIYAFGKIMLKSDSLLEIFAGFNFASDYQILYVLCIPFIWLALHICDRLQCRFRTD
jgi:hypothetical protein